MAKFEFPQNPGTQRENPFEDEQGANPFSDGTPVADEPIADNLLAVTDESPQRSYTPDDYEAILIPSAQRALLLAILGLVPACLGVVGAAFAILASSAWTSALFFAMPLQFAALAFAIPACIFARRDLRAMKAGAMDGAERGKSRLALAIGVCGVLLGSAPVLLYLGLLIWFA